MNADTIGSGIISAYWSVKPNGPVINLGPNPVPWDATVDITIMGPNAYHFSVGEYYLYFVAQNGQGCSSIDSTKIVFYDVPVAYAGIDTSVCGKSYDLEGSWSLDNPTGLWSPLTGNPGSANFTPNDEPLSQVTVTQYGIYYFVWKEMNAANTVCSDRDTITVEFKTVPMPDAGLDFTVCGLFANIIATPSVPGGQWSGPSGIAYYDGLYGNYDMSFQDSTSSYIRWPSENDTVTMYWSEFNGVCNGYDSVNVYFSSIQPAESLVDSTDTVVCGPVFTLLNAQQPAYGYGYWMDTVQNTTFSPSPTENGPTATIDTGSVDYYGYHHFYWITVNGVCRDTSEVAPVKFIEMPHAYAGGHYWPGLFGANSHIKTDTVCGLSYEMGAIPSIGDGLWYSLDPTNVHFDSANAITSPWYMDSLYLTCTGCYSVFSTPKYREFIWQENNENCVHSDTLRLYFAPFPSGQLVTATLPLSMPTMPQCRHDSSMIIANTWPLPGNVDYGIVGFYWTYSTGGVLSPVITSPTTSDTIYVSWPSGEQHSVSLTTINRWGCLSGGNSYNVIEPAAFNPSYDLTPTECMQNNGSVELSTANGSDPNFYTFHWIPDSIFQNPLSVLQEGLSPLTDYNVIVTGESLSPDATPGVTCSDTLTIFVPDTGKIIAQFDTLNLEQHEAAPYTIQLINTTIGGRKFSWRFYDENGTLIGTSTLEDPPFTFTDEGCYQIVLVATSKQGCIDTMIYDPFCVDAVPILEIPNVFTPNGDGNNDVFIVHGKSIVEFHAVIFNRWGKKLYEWEDVDKGWDGKIGSSEASPGSYFYKITAKDKKEKEYEFNGFFYLLREK